MTLRTNPFSVLLTLSQTSPGYYLSAVRVLKTVGKEEIARDQQFLFLPQCFSICSENFLSFSSNLKLLAANSFSLEESKFCRLGKGQARILSLQPACLNMLSEAAFKMDKSKIFLVDTCNELTLNQTIPTFNNL